MRQLDSAVLSFAQQNHPLGRNIPYPCHKCLPCLSKASGCSVQASDCWNSERIVVVSSLLGTQFPKREINHWLQRINLTHHIKSRHPKKNIINVITVLLLLHHSLASLHSGLYPRVKLVTSTAHAASTYVLLTRTSHLTSSYVYPHGCLTIYSAFSSPTNPILAFAHRKYDGTGLPGLDENPPTTTSRYHATFTILTTCLPHPDDPCIESLNCLLPPPEIIIPSFLPYLHSYHSITSCIPIRHRRCKLVATVSI